MISRKAYALYSLISLLLVLNCKPSGPFLNYLISLSASSIGLIITFYDTKEEHANN